MTNVDPLRGVRYRLHVVYPPHVIDDVFDVVVGRKFKVQQRPQRERYAAHSYLVLT